MASSGWPDRSRRVVGLFDVLDALSPLARGAGEGELAGLIEALAQTRDIFVARHPGYASIAPSRPPRVGPPLSPGVARALADYVRTALTDLVGEAHILGEPALGALLNAIVGVPDPARHVTPRPAPVLVWQA